MAKGSLWTRVAAWLALVVARKKEDINFYLCIAQVLWQHPVAVASMNNDAAVSLKA